MRRCMKKEKKERETERQSEGERNCGSSCTNKKGGGEALCRATAPHDPIFIKTLLSKFRNHIITTFARHSSAHHPQNTLL